MRVKKWWDRYREAKKSYRTGLLIALIAMTIITAIFFSVRMVGPVLFLAVLVYLAKQAETENKNLLSPQDVYNLEMDILRLKKRQEVLKEHSATFPEQLDVKLEISELSIEIDELERELNEVQNKFKKK
jgi:hypothetical protein